MQASKIEPGRVYAIKHGDELARFRVTAVHTTKRAGTVPKSTVDGHLTEPGLMENMTISPDELLGEFNGYVELVNKQKQEHEEADRKRKAQDRRRERCAVLLRNFFGYPEEAAHAGYGRIFINDQALDAIIAKLETHCPP